MAKGAGGGVGGGIKAIFGTEFDDILKGDHADGDTIYGLGGNDKITALNGNDFLFGGDGNDTIFGAGGNDTIWGGAGNDIIDGGAGNDWAIYGDVGGSVNIDLAITTAQNTLSAGFDKLVNIENVLGSVYNDSLKGNALANTLNGNGGSDVIDGRDGNDSISAGDGDDVINGGNGNDVLDMVEGVAGTDIVDGGAGIDKASYFFFGSGAGVTVDLRITTAQDTGLGGFDTLLNIENLEGSTRNDTLTGDDGANAIFGGAGNDVVTGNGGNDVLNGFTGSDIVSGGAGDDVIDGGMTGALGEIDTLSGGAGADRFFFETLGASWTGSNDQILDFSSLEGDKIDIHGVFLNGGAPVIGLSPVFIGGAAFTGVAGQLQVIKTFGDIGVNQLVNVDWDGNGAADFTVAVTSDALLTASDFIL